MTNSLMYLVMIALFLGFMTSCSSEKDEPAPVLESIAVDNVTSLTEAGEMSVTFTPKPAGAVISAANTDAKGFEVAKIERTGNKQCQVTLKVTDFAYVKSGETIRLTLSQADGVSASANVTVEDPFSIEGRYGLAYPQSFTLYDKESKQTIGLPIIATAGEITDLAEIASMQFVTVSNVISNGWTSDLFELKAMTDEVGCFLVGTQEAIDKICEQKIPTSLRSFGITLTAKNGRKTTIDLESYVGPPETTFENEALTATTTELSSAGFKKQGVLDASLSMRRIGFLEPLDNADPDASKFYQEMMYILDSNGQEVDNPMLISDINITTFELDYILSGSANDDITPGIYYNVYHYVLNWDFRGKTYPRIAANINYEVSVK